MEKLTTDVMDATGLDPSIAKAAIGHVLLFLRNEAPQGRVAEFIDKTPKAQEAIEAAAAHGDGGVTVAIEGMTSFMGRGRADTNILAGRLANLGLDERQIMALVSRIVSRAEILLGPEDAARIKSLLPMLDERLGIAPAHEARPDPGMA
ncbi:hypothetical protein [Methylocystis heyeri]|uniref:DUF2267 domain-containing protein n=1 Tax=Methylocystis heyeri TaxID=391905 RepID=A0A6B8KG78_9HYPH|nr:hypothetical protein [Methylocystis heyeri]QGM45985.1 hypothetical protein H2LOC_009880 [Methylocystis heyeri]